MNRTIRWMLAALVAPLTLAGCSKSTLPTETSLYSADSPALLQMMPAPTSPAGAIQALDWCIHRRNWRQLAELLTDDYQFVFAASDSSGNAFTGHMLLRTDELACSEHLFETGTATEPPASAAYMIFDRNLVATPDPRPGKDPAVHQVIDTQVTATVEAGDHQYRILGHARFYLVRGDSAAIPPDLAARGFHSDPSRWWIERWEDFTAYGVGGAPVVEGALPTHNVSWGSIQALYR
jgi:hypothetical protein